MIRITIFIRMDSTSTSSARSSLSLPLFISNANRVKVGFCVFVISGVLYLLANHFHFVEPRLLPMTWVDLNVPFLPNTFWIYNSEYIYFILIYAICRDITNLNRYVYSFLALLLVSVVIFDVWPTIYPRGGYALPDDLNSITRDAFNGLRKIDTPANCCPSLHVSGVYLSSFVFLNEQRSKFFFFFTWGTLIAISTLTTKQHYLADVISGFGMAVLFHWLFFKVVQYRKA